MAEYSYSIASGFDVAPSDQDNLEDIIENAPVGQRVPLGSVQRVTLNRRTQNNGAQDFVWRWSIMTAEHFATLLTYLGSDLSVGDAPVSVTTPNHLNSYTTYNAYMVNPLPDVAYQLEACGFVSDLKLQFRVVEQSFGELLLETGFGLLLETGGKILTE